MLFPLFLIINELEKMHANFSNCERKPIGWYNRIDPLEKLTSQINFPGVKNGVITIIVSSDSPGDVTMDDVSDSDAQGVSSSGVSPIDLSTSRKEKLILEDKSNLIQSLAAIASPQVKIGSCQSLFPEFRNDFLVAFLFNWSLLKIPKKNSAPALEIRKCFESFPPNSAPLPLCPTGCSTEGRENDGWSHDGTNPLSISPTNDVIWSPDDDTKQCRRWPAVLRTNHVG